MTLQQLRYVIAIAETGSLGRAAEKLFVAQPSLTNSLKDLERELGITLFLRTSKGMTLVDGKGGMFMLMDVDKFKSINDNYGHDVGDKVLIAIADCLKKSFRDNDIVMRLGGDEFAAYAPTVLNEKVGQQIIDRFFDNIDKIKIPELGDRKICISMGVAFYHPNDEYSFDD